MSLSFSFISLVAVVCRHLPMLMYLRTQVLLKDGGPGGLVHIEMVYQT